ncbi:hypothetical protein GGF31_007313 [Allomyces arbusculus]|nr:hypothetical protein GGF31_007313 [Allomyces arbusculus]
MNNDCELGQMHAALAHQALANVTAMADGSPPTPLLYPQLPAQVIVPAATRFHAYAPPTTLITAILEGIFRYAPCPTAVFLPVLMYLDRLAHLPSHALIVTSANVHRLLITATMVATKYWSDVFYTNAHYAKIGGLSAAQLSQLEMDILMLLDFDLKLDPADFVRYAGRLLVHVAAAVTTRDEKGSAVTHPAPTPSHAPSSIPTNSSIYVSIEAVSASPDQMALHSPPRTPILAPQQQRLSLDQQLDVDDDLTLSPKQHAALAQVHTITTLEGYSDDATMSPEQRAALAQMRTITIVEGDGGEGVVVGDHVEW